MSFLFKSSPSSPLSQRRKATDTKGNMAASLSLRTPEEAVARIAYLSSDVIVSVQPSQDVQSGFSTHLQTYASNKDQSVVAASESRIPDIQTVRQNADPLLSVFAPIRSGKLTSVTT
ncbi:hypothetical protein V491_09126, partial [Pseudogymnoascus sp. VKM F-3775]